MNRSYPCAPHRPVPVPRFPVALLLAALLWPAAALAQVGELEVLQGYVVVHRGPIVISVTDRAALQHGDRLRTGEGSRAYVRLAGELDGSELLISQNTELRLNDLALPTPRSPLELVAGAVRSRLLRWGLALPFMETTTAVVGVKGTDFIVYTERPDASQFIGVEGLIEARSRSLPTLAIELGPREWGEIVENEPPRPPIRVPDDIWSAAQAEFAFPGESGFGPTSPE